MVLKASLVSILLNHERPMASIPWLISLGEALRLRSITTARPPGLSTRHISLRAATGSAKFLKAARHNRKSKLAAGNGMLDAEPCWKLACTPATAAFLAA